MWVKFMDVADGYAALMWREVFNQEALSVRIVPPVEVGGMKDPRKSGCRTARRTWHVRY